MIPYYGITFQFINIYFFLTHLLWGLSFFAVNFCVHSHYYIINVNLIFWLSRHYISLWLWVIIRLYHRFWLASNVWCRCLILVYHSKL
jgi:hypothetical protein